MEDALFEEDYSKLDIFVFSENFVFYLRGSNDGKVSMITMLEKKDSNGQWMGWHLSSNAWGTFGKFEFKDPELEGTCDDVANVTTTVTLGTSTMVFKGSRRFWYGRRRLCKSLSRDGHG